MANEIFSVTTTIGTKTLTFSTSGHSVKDTTTYVFNQVSDTTISGSRMVSNLGSHYKQYDYTVVVPMAHGSNTDWADILEFIGTDYANGGVNSFTWTDYASTAKTVKLISTSISMKNLGNNLCRVEFVLEEVN